MARLHGLFVPAIRLAGMPHSVCALCCCIVFIKKWMYVEIQKDYLFAEADLAKNAITCNRMSAIGRWTAFSVTIEVDKKNLWPIRAIWWKTSNRRPSISVCKASTNYLEFTKHDRLKWSLSKCNKELLRECHQRCRLQVSESSVEGWRLRDWYFVSMVHGGDRCTGKRVVAHKRLNTWNWVIFDLTAKVAKVRRLPFPKTCGMKLRMAEKENYRRLSLSQPFWARMTRGDAPAVKAFCR